MKKLYLLFSVLYISILSIGQTNLSLIKVDKLQLLDTDGPHHFQIMNSAYPISLMLNQQSSGKQPALTTTETKQQLDSIVGEIWLSGYETWLNFYKAEYLYDESGLATKYVLSFLDEQTEIWDLAQRIFFEYDANRNMIQSYSQFWNYTDSIWFDNHKTENTYNDKNQLTNHIFIAWDEVEELWVDNFKLEYYYDSKDLLQKTYYYSGLYDSIDWKLGEKVEYTYDSEDKLTQLVASDIIDSTGGWQDYYRQLVSYDADQNVSQNVIQDWDINQNEWVNDDKEEYTYDEYGNNTITYEYSWTEAENNWSQDFLSNHNYNLDYSYNELILPPANPFSFLILDMVPTQVNMQTSSTRQFYMLDDWVNWDRDTYYYSEQDVSDVPSLVSGKFLVYPNPANDYVQIQMINTTNQAVFEIIDLTGKKVLSQNIINQITIKLDQLISGLYIYKIIHGKQIYTGKLIVQ